MNPDTDSTPTIWTRFLRLWARTEERRAERARHAGDHRPRRGAALRKHRRQMAQASRRMQRRRDHK